MPELLDWQSVTAPLKLVRSLVRALTRGQVLVLPSEAGYLAAASALLPGGVERLRRLGKSESLEIAVADVQAARDWVPGLGSVGQRLAHRLWPGPLVLACTERDGGLSGRLPAGLRSHLCPGRALRLRCPNHDAILAMIRESSIPLALVSLPGAATPIAATLRQLPNEVIDNVDGLIDDGPTPLSHPPAVVAVEEESWSLVRPGVLTEDQVKGLVARLIVFICTGNTCRSPLAEALCKKRLADRLGCGVDELPARGYVVTSAGLAAGPGMPAAAEAVAVARDLGANLENHRSKPLSGDLAARADVLIAMTHSHLRALCDHFPTLGASPRLLNSAGQDLSDPIGQPRPVYEECARQISEDLEALVSSLTGHEKGEQP
jgi:protein-tyrosine phosphatase